MCIRRFYFITLRMRKQAGDRKKHYKNGRWGEAEKEKGLGDLFPDEPTDEPFMARRP